jgi:hypothetical protein
VSQDDSGRGSRRLSPIDRNSIDKRPEHGDSLVMMMAFAALFRLPPEDLTAPTSLPTEPAAARQWLDSLPRTNLGHSSRALFQAVTELNRVTLAPHQRLELLEQLRPVVHFICQGLSRHYLGQPLALPDQPLKVAQLAHTLLEGLTQGYVRVALQIQQQPRGSGFRTPAQALATVLHRALSDTSLNLLRDFQLYRDPRRSTWARLHRLASWAQRQQLDAVSVADPLGGSGTLRAAYIRALLLGSAHTYQLRQDEIARLWQRLPAWTSLASLTAAGSSDGLLVDPRSDEGPRRPELISVPIDAGWLCLDTSAVCAQLATELEADTTTALDQLSSEALTLVQQAWQRSLRRHQERQPCSVTVEVALGLAAAHHFISGEADFDLLLSLSGHQRLQPAQRNPFLKQSGSPVPQRPRDVWDSAYQTRFKAEAVEAIDYQVRSHHQQQSKQQARYQAVEATTVNTSAGGYCLQWNGHAAPVKTGEIIAIREKDHKIWRVGVVRWVRLDQTGPQWGVELLSPTATAYGGRVIHKSGPPGDYLRVLVLPAMPELRLPPTLITPRLPFRVGQKVQLAVRDDEARVQLTRRLRAAAGFSQFEFSRLGGVSVSQQSEPEQAPGSSFDSLWEIL